MDLSEVLIIDRERNMQMNLEYNDFGGSVREPFPKSLGIKFIEKNN